MVRRAAENSGGESPRRQLSRGDCSQLLRRIASVRAILPSAHSRATEYCASGSSRPTAACHQALRLRETDRNSTPRHPFSIACESAEEHWRSLLGCRDTLETKGFRFLRREKTRWAQQAGVPADFPAAGPSSDAAE